MPASTDRREIYLKTEKGEIDVFICPDPNIMDQKKSPSPARSQPGPSASHSQIKRNLSKSFAETSTSASQEDSNSQFAELLDESSIPFVPFLSGNNFYSKCDDFTASNFVKTKLSPKAVCGAAGEGSGSQKGQTTGVRNALISENSNLSPLLLSQTDYNGNLTNGFSFINFLWFLTNTNQCLTKNHDPE